MFNPSCTLTPNTNHTFKAHVQFLQTFAVASITARPLFLITTRPGAISMEKSYIPRETIPESPHRPVCVFGFVANRG